MRWKIHKHLRDASFVDIELTAAGTKEARRLAGMTESAVTLIMLAVSKSTLRIIAGFVWFSGAIVLLLKGSSLFAQAIALKPGEPWSWLAVAAALLIGGVKAQFLFGGFCRKNLDRIADLDDPQLWQAFRPGFYVFLTTMILLGAILSRLAIGIYPALMALVILDISIAVALLGSIRVFSQHP